MLMFIQHALFNYSIYFGLLLGNLKETVHRRHRCRWMNNINTNLTLNRIGGGGGTWIHCSGYEPVTGSHKLPDSMNSWLPDDLLGSEGLYYMKLVVIEQNHARYSWEKKIIFAKCIALLIISSEYTHNCFVLSTVKQTRIN